MIFSQKNTSMLLEPYILLFWKRLCRFVWWPLSTISIVPDPTKNPEANLDMRVFLSIMPKAVYKGWLFLLLEWSYFIETIGHFFNIMLDQKKSRYMVAKPGEFLTGCLRKLFCSQSELLCLLGMPGANTCRGHYCHHLHHRYCCCPLLRKKQNALEEDWNHLRPSLQ